MGRPSEQIQCNDWTAAYVLDDAALSFGSWVEHETKRYANHTPEAVKGAKQPKPPSIEQVTEYQRALLEGTLFRRIVAKKRLPTKARPADTA